MREHPATKSMLSLVDVLRKAAYRSPVDRYFGRVDGMLAEFDRDESLKFLRGELDKWMTRYQQFQTAVLTDQPTGLNESAWNYAETIAVLGTRIAQFERQKVAA